MLRQALVVGINNYPGLQNLKTPAGDAELIASLLQKHGGFQVVKRLPVKDNQGFLSVDENPSPQQLVTATTLQEAIAKLFNPQGNDVPDTALLYFAGHGLRNDKGIIEGFLATSNANPRKDVWGVSLNWLQRILKSSPVKEQIIWLDCCYGGELLNGQFLNFDEANPGERGKGRDRCFIAACGDASVAYGNAEHGILTSLLLKGLDPQRYEVSQWINNYSLTDFIIQQLENDEKLRTFPQRPSYNNSGGEIKLIQGKAKPYEEATIGNTSKQQLQILLHWLIRLLEDDAFDCIQVDSTAIPGKNLSVTANNIVVFYKDGHSSFIQTQDTENWENQNQLDLERLVPNSKLAMLVLERYIQNNNHNNNTHLRDTKYKITRSDILAELAKHELNPTPKRSEAEILANFNSASSIGRYWLREIDGKKISRSELPQIIELIKQGSRTILLIDRPGSGKTCMLLDLADYIEQEKASVWGLLFIKGDKFTNISSEQELTAHGLPEDIVGQCARLADYRKVVVIIDSLDVLSLSRQHGSLKVFLGIIDRLEKLEGVTVIVACRNFDLEYDPLLRGRSWQHKINLQPLDFDTQVKSFLIDWQVDVSKITPVLRSLLQIPQNLWIYERLAKLGVPSQPASAYELYNSFLEEVVVKNSTLGTEAIDALQNMAEQLMQQRTQSYSKVSFGASEDTVRQLISQEVLLETSPGILEFSHKTFLDMLIDEQQSITKNIKLDNSNQDTSWNLFACFSVSLKHFKPEEIDFFACLSVCAKDGFSLKTAMAATDCDKSHTRYYLQKLYQFSLINDTDMGEERYIFHPLIYRFAQEKAIEHNLKDDAEKRHAQFCIQLIKSIDNHNYSIIPVLSQDANDIMLATKWLLNKEILDYEFTENLNTFFEEENTYNKEASELMSDFQSLSAKIEDWENFVIFCTRTAKFLCLQSELLKAESVLQCLPDIILRKIPPSNVREYSRVKYFIRLGNVLQRQERFNEAQDNLQNSIAISQQLGDKILLRNAKATLLNILKQQQQHKEALNLSEEIVNISEEIGDKKSLVKDLNNLASSLEKLGRNEEAVDKIKLSIEISNDIFNHKQLLSSLQLLAQLQKKLGRLEEANEALEQSAEISKTLKHEGILTTTAIISFRHGSILQNQGKLSEALQAFLHAFELRNALKDLKPLLAVFRILGRSMQKQKMLDEAKKAFECVIDISKELGDKDTLATGFNLLGHILKEQGELKKAEQYFLDQIEIGKILQKRRQLIVGLDSLVEISLKIGDLDQALQAFMERIEISSEKKSFYVILSGLAKYLQEQEGRLEALLQAFQRKIELYESQNDQQKLDILLSILRRSLKEENKLEEALQALKSKIKTDNFLFLKRSTCMMLNLLGRLLQEQGNLEKAYDAYQTQIEISEHIPDQQQLASGLYCVGKLQKEQFNLEDAKKNLERCVEIRKNSTDWEQYAIELLTLGEILIGMGELDKAEDVFRESVKNCKTNNYQNTLANGLHKLGHLLKDQEKIDQAIEVFKEQTEISETPENKQLLVHGLLRLGELYQENKQLNKALQVLINAANYCEMLNDHSILVFHLRKLGQKLQKKGEIEEAKLAFSSMIKIGETFKDWKTLDPGYNFLGKIFQKEGDFEKAQQAFKSQVEIGQDYYKLKPIVKGLEDLYNINCLNILLKQKFDEAMQALKQVIDINDSLYENSELFTETSDISKLFEESLQKLQKVIQLDEIINSELNIANVLSSIIEQKLFEIRETLGKSFNLVDKSKDKYGQAIVCYIAGALLQKHQYKFEEKLQSLPDYFNKSIQLAEELGETEHLAKVYISKGQYLVSRGETEKAVEEMCKGFIHYEKLQNSFGLGIVTPLLIFSLIKIGRLHDATDYCQRALEVNYNQKSLHKLSELLYSEILFRVGSVEYIDERNKKYGYIATNNGSHDIRFYNKVNLLKGNLVEVICKQDSKGIHAQIIRIIAK